MSPMPRCPLCGRELQWLPASHRGRVKGYCSCHPLGAVVETDGNDPSIEVFTSLRGVGGEIASTLVKHGYRTLDDLRQATDRQLIAIPGIGESLLRSIREQITEG